MSIETPRPGAARRTALWPWAAAWALGSVPAALVLLVVGEALLNHWTGVPGTSHQGWVLLGIVLLSLLPVLLLLLDNLASSGGSFQAPGGVKISFEAASTRVAATVTSTTLSENLGTLGTEAANQSGMRSILKALRASERTEVTVVDLRDGNTWWESRFFILVASAARRRSNQALAVIATDNEQTHTFVGWADPVRLLELHLAAHPVLNLAFERAEAWYLQWQASMPNEPDVGPGVPPVVPAQPPSSRTAPWGPTQLALPPLVEEASDPAFGFELFLQRELDQLAGSYPDTRNPVTVNRVLELYRAALVTDSVDVGASLEEWVQLLNGPSRRFFALTSAGVFRALVPREALLAALVGTLVRAEASGDPVR
jgi:hypothetical protein